VLSRKVPGFVPAEQLAAGDVLFLVDGKAGVISSIATESAPHGQTFTTYNFEVAEFHTYFAGASGAWVHNRGSACDKIRELYHFFRTGGQEPWDALNDTIALTRKLFDTAKMPASSQLFVSAATAAMDDLAAAAGTVHWPNYREVRSVLSGSDKNGLLAKALSNKYGYDFGKFGTWEHRLEAHHGIPSEVQGWLHMTKPKDDCPMYLTTFLEHRGESGESIHAKISEKLGEKMGIPSFPLNQGPPPGLSDVEILEALRDAYEEKGLSSFWKACESWMTAP